jgi:ribonuclease HII
MFPNFDIENSYKGLVAGIDEAGRGPLAGPVVASCVILDRERFPSGLNDSKKLSGKRRDELFCELMELGDLGFFRFGVGIVSPQEIDRMNIRNATKLAMRMAFEDLIRKCRCVDCDLPNVVLVDGNFVPNGIKARAEYVIKGDAKSLSIASASIVAKVTRDKIMYELDREFPCYEWGENKGYGSESHINAIWKYGITKHHRKSFCCLQGKLF